MLSAYNSFILFSSTDERDAIQKKTFTKWVNKHLKKVSTVLGGRVQGGRMEVGALEEEE